MYYILIETECPHPSRSEHIEAGVAADAFATAQHAIITAVHGSNPNHTVHFLCKLPPLWSVFTCQSNKLQGLEQL